MARRFIGYGASTEANAYLNCICCDAATIAIAVIIIVHDTPNCVNVYDSMANKTQCTFTFAVHWLLFTSRNITLKNHFYCTFARCEHRLVLAHCKRFFLRSFNFLNWCVVVYFGRYCCLSKPRIHVLFFWLGNVNALILAHFYSPLVQHYSIWCASIGRWTIKLLAWMQFNGNGHVWRLSFALSQYRSYADQ